MTNVVKMAIIQSIQQLHAAGRMNVCNPRCIAPLFGLAQSLNVRMQEAAEHQLNRLEFLELTLHVRSANHS